MQQAYQALRVISEAQTVQIVLATRPGALMLTELRIISEALQAGSSDGIKAVILDFADQAHSQNEHQAGPPELLDQARASVRAIPQPILAVVRASLAEVACAFLVEADFTLVAREAELCLPASSETSEQRIGGVAAARLGYATWNAPAADLNQEMERILDMLRAKSALALRHAKASARLVPLESAPVGSDAQLAALQRINQYYLENVTTTRDAREGLQAFLEKREPRWQNR